MIWKVWGNEFMLSHSSTVVHWNNINPFPHTLQFTNCGGLSLCYPNPPQWRIGNKLSLERKNFQSSTMKDWQKFVLKEKKISILHSEGMTRNLSLERYYYQSSTVEDWWKSIGFMYNFHMLHRNGNAQRRRRRDGSNSPFVTQGTSQFHHSWQNIPTHG